MLLLLLLPVRFQRDLSAWDGDSMGVHLYTNGAWTDAGKIYRNSLNLFNGVIAIDDSILTDNGKPLPFQNYAVSEYIDILPNTEYTFSFFHNAEENRTTFTLSTYDEQKSTILPLEMQTINNIQGYTMHITTSASARYLRINWKKPYDEDMMLVQGNIALPYEPYNVVDWYTNNGHDYSSGAWS